MRSRAWLLGLSLVGLITILSSTASAEGRRIVVEGFEKHHDSSISLQLNASSLSLSDDGLDINGAAQLGGLNLGFRWDPVEWGGLEVTMGGYGRSSDDGLVTESRSLATLSWLWYFARHHRHRFYGVTGVAGLDTHLSIGNSSLEYSEGGLVLGLGSEWLVRKNWLISFDVRTLTLGRDKEREAIFAQNAPAPDGLERSPFPESWTAIPDERVGVLFNLGLGYRW